MAEDNAHALSGPDLRAGVRFDELTESMPLLGQFDGEPVILVRQGDQLFATGAVCTHYGGPLAEGLVVDQTIRCPWHHARFNLRTGEAEGAPALNPVSCFNVVRHEGMVMVDGKKATDFRAPRNLNPSSYARNRESMYQLLLPGRPALLIMQIIIHDKRRCPNDLGIETKSRYFKRNIGGHPGYTMFVQRLLN